MDARFKKQIERAAYLLGIVGVFFGEYDIAAELPISFDGAECDGSVLGGDCSAAADDLRVSMKEVV